MAGKVLKVKREQGMRDRILEQLANIAIAWVSKSENQKQLVEWAEKLASLITDKLNKKDDPNNGNA